MSKRSPKIRYSVIIQWSNEDACFIVSLPEWGPYAATHGKTYEEAARNAHEVLELLMTDEPSLPTPKLFEYPGADLIQMSQPLKSKRKIRQTA